MQLGWRRRKRLRNSSLGCVARKLDLVWSRPNLVAEERLCSCGNYAGIDATRVGVEIRRFHSQPIVGVMAIFRQQPGYSRRLDSGLR